MALDRAEVKGIADYAGWPASLAEEYPAQFATAALVLELPNKLGGWGMTLVRGVSAVGSQQSPQSPDSRICTVPSRHAARHLDPPAHHGHARATLPTDSPRGCAGGPAAADTAGNPCRA
eukprot:645330-Rhodomonas_salina.1